VPLPRRHDLVEPSCPRRGSQDSHQPWINRSGSGQLLITATAVVVAYALRNAAADFAALPAEWHQRLAAAARKVSGHPFSHVETNWEAHQARYDAIRKEMRHDDELDDALDSDPTSLRNAMRRLADE
jgi:hypothetical protein